MDLKAAMSDIATKKSVKRSSAIDKAFKATVRLVSASIRAKKSCHGSQAGVAGAAVAGRGDGGGAAEGTVD